MTAGSVLLGMNLYPARGDAGRRQARAAATLAAVAPVHPVNLQFADRDDLFEVDGVETLLVLQEDSRTVTGRPGPRKPVVNELFTRLAEAALRRGCRYFGFANSDIVITPAAVERVLRGDHRVFVFSRTDFDPGTERDRGPLIYGTDVFVVEAGWWLTNRGWFRPYIAGEMAWDNVYTAQLLCWAGGLLLNREPLVRHEWHEVVWKESPFAAHNGYLAALDRPYFTRWVTYAHKLGVMRNRLGGLAHAQAERQLLEEVFTGWRPDLLGRATHLLRLGKLWIRGRTR